jgi:hypothetical protein
MKITYNHPTPHTKKLGDIPNGEVFRFSSCKVPCIRVNLNGNEVFQAYHYYYDIEDALDECIIVHEEELYVWDNKEEQLDYEHYQQSNALDNLLAYISLDTGKIYVSHIDEQVVPLKADLIIDEMRSPD